MNHHNNIRNPHQAPPHNSHIRSHNPMSMMPPRSQIIPFISTQQSRDPHRLGPHIPQQHSQQRMNSQMHQNPQIHHSKNRNLSNQNNTNNHNINNTVHHGNGPVLISSVKQQQTAPVHPHVLQNISHNYQQKNITGNHYHGKSSVQQHPKLNDEEKLKEQIRNITNSIQSQNQQQQQLQPQQYQNSRRNIPNQLHNSKQNHLPPHLPHQQQQLQQQHIPKLQQQPQIPKYQQQNPKLQQQQQPNPKLHQQQQQNPKLKQQLQQTHKLQQQTPKLPQEQLQIPKQQQQVQHQQAQKNQQQQQGQDQHQISQKIQTKIQPKLVLLNQNITQQEILQNAISPKIRKSPPLTIQKINVRTTSTSSKSAVSNVSTKIANVQSDSPVASTQEQITNKVQTSIVEIPSEQTPTVNPMASVPPAVEQQTLPTTIKEEKYTCGQILQSPTIENLTNLKDKTPMCLVNELARFNKIEHQYRLTGEQGPAHNKRFTVTLKLGDEEYTAEGPSIKKTQHTAASEAVTNTKFEHPPTKTIRHKSSTTHARTATLTPTVELNALAMKLGEQTIYVFDPSASNNTNVHSGANNDNGGPISPHHPPLNNYLHPLTQVKRLFPENGQYQILSRNNFVGNNVQHPRYHLTFSQRGTIPKYNLNPRWNFNPIYGANACSITLIVGKKKFVGAGPTIQSAKHDAAAKALEILKPIQEDSASEENTETTKIEETIADNKSPISVVHEMALKRNLTVSFAVGDESGPPHLRTYKTICTVGTIETNGEGNGKKVSKKRAAEKMLEELKKLPPVVNEKAAVVNPGNNGNSRNPGKSRNSSKRSIPGQSQGQTPNVGRKKSKSLIKENSEPLDKTEFFNPVLKLAQIQQELKETEPTYTLIEERGAPRRREFVVVVNTSKMSTEGIGSSKKVAKKVAARNMLTLIGFDPKSLSNKENELNIVNIDNKINNSESNKPMHLLNEDVNSRPTNNNNSNNNNSCNSLSTTTIDNSLSTTTSQTGNSSKKIVPAINNFPQNKLNPSEIVEINQNIKSKVNVKQGQNLSDNLNESHNKSLSIELPQQTEPVKPISPKLENKVSSTNDFVVRPKDQLLYLAQLLGFQAVFSDYPKGNHGEYLTIVTLSTDPPQICHGAGPDTDASQDIAASTALQMLSKLGLDNVCPIQNKSSQVLAAAAADSSKNLKIKK